MVDMPIDPDKLVYKSKKFVSREAYGQLTPAQAERTIKSIYKRIADEFGKNEIKYFDLIEQITNDLNQIGF